MLFALKNVAAVATLLIAGTLASQAAEAGRSYRVSFQEDGPTGMRSRGVSSAHDGEEMRFAGWTGPGGREASPGYDLRFTPTQREGFIDVTVEGRLNVAYGNPVVGPRPVNRNTFKAHVTLEKTPGGWVYEQAGLPDNGTFRLTFAEN